MARKEPTKRGPKPETLKVDGDPGVVLDRLLGKDGSFRRKKVAKKKRAKRRKKR